MIVAGGSAFFAEYEASRVLCFTGSLGSGKSLMSHMIAEKYLKEGYKLITNMASVWADDILEVHPDKKGQYHCIVILDEGGIYVRTAKTVQKIHTFARKLDTYLMFAGRKLPHEDLQEFTCALWFDFQKHFLLPLKVYKWEVWKSQGKRYSGYIWVTGMEKYYGVYSTLDPGDFPGSIVATFEIWTKIFFDKFGREYKIQDVVDGENQNQEIIAEFGKLSREAQRSLSVPQRKTSKGRKS